MSFCFSMFSPIITCLKLVFRVRQDLYINWFADRISFRFWHCAAIANCSQVYVWVYPELYIKCSGKFGCVELSLLMQLLKKRCFQEASSFWASFQKQLTKEQQFQKVFCFSLSCSKPLIAFKQGFGLTQTCSSNSYIGGSPKILRPKFRCVSSCESIFWLPI